MLYLYLLSIFMMFFISIIAPQIIELFYETNKMPKEQLSLSNKASELLKNNKILVSEIRIIKSNEVNAIVAGLFKFNIKIYITDYLLKNFSEEEVLVVIAHEMAHIQSNHKMKKILTSILFLTSYVFLSTDFFIPYIQKMDLFKIKDELFLNIIIWYFYLILPYINRKNEYEADLKSVKIINQPQLVYQTLLKIKQLHNNEKYSKFFNIFNDHPTFDKRLAHIKFYI